MHTFRPPFYRTYTTLADPIRKWIPTAGGPPPLTLDTSDTAVATDVFSSKAIGRVMSETATATDTALIKNLSRVMSTDTSTITDVPAKALSILIPSDSLSITDSLTYLRTLNSSLSEASAITESLQVDLSKKMVNDVIAFTDTMLHNLSKFITNDTTSITDVFTTKVVGKNPLDTIIVTDTPTFNFSYSMSEITGITDIFDYSLTTPGWVPILRSVKGSPLTTSEVDTNFSNINSKKLERISASDTASVTVYPYGSGIMNFSALNLADNAVIKNPTVVPPDGWQITIKLSNPVSSVSFTWENQWRPIGLTLPTSLIAGKAIYVGAVYNNADSVFDVIAVATQQ